MSSTSASASLTSLNILFQTDFITPRTKATGRSHSKNLIYFRIIHHFSSLNKISFSKMGQNVSEKPFVLCPFDANGGGWWWCNY